MNAFELLNPDGKPSGIWACSACHYSSNSRSAMDHCCLCIHCKQLVKREPGASRSPYHERCHRQEQAAREFRRYTKAQKVDAYDGWVFVDGLGHNEGFFRDVQELVEYLVEYLDDSASEEEYETGTFAWPEYAWACKPVPFRVPSAYEIVERLCEDGYEDMADDVVGVDALEWALAAFAKANEHLVSYEPDYSRYVDVPKPNHPSQPTDSSTEIPQEPKPN